MTDVVAIFNALYGMVRSLFYPEKMDVIANADVV